MSSVWFMFAFQKVLILHNGTQDFMMSCAKQVFNVQATPSMCRMSYQCTPFSPMCRQHVIYGLFFTHIRVFTSHFYLSEVTFMGVTLYCIVNTLINSPFAQLLMYARLIWLNVDSPYGNSIPMSLQQFLLCVYRQHID